MEILILGTGCPKCEKLAAETTAAAEDLGLTFALRKVTQVADIMKYGVMLTPALVVDGKVKVAGKVPSRDELKTMLT
ncbi:MAG: TM0996/MTH895 family glutaredoxin-like protein [Krumholzibacteria bacterium]|nr:TM0996/MTH895 family glutaredoxin-like protein [Candidatus Krumholzibacteria bacterium]